MIKTFYGGYVSGKDLDNVLYDLKTIATYLAKVAKVPLSTHILEKYKDDFERIDLL